MEYNKRCNDNTGKWRSTVCEDSPQIDVFQKYNNGIGSENAKDRQRRIRQDTDNTLCTLIRREMPPGKPSPLLPSSVLMLLTDLHCDVLDVLSFTKRKDQRCDHKRNDL
ncbi:hypothetical protein CAEBREN_06525 [Caenorhabditis brenneri]|uniref:Uncharacterized protein n=1 Tax=Caenorhabditis brenneri TaxID=135651 RepID=G0P519_CAEBE|nr:hypothetical protein CAEBREN_06525 [Caenorhabditis brenneri]